MYYPKPFRGIFYIISLEIANRLNLKWHGRGPIDDPERGYYAVGKIKNGVCPLAMMPVHQAFHPQAIAHRYTQSAATYAMQINNGYSGEGAVWCAPHR